jgi:hypothetical protein
MTPGLPPAIYVDVDDTLLRSSGSKRIPMTAMVSLVRALRAAGATLFCWSTAGATYARDAAEELGLRDCFEAFLPKPQILLDDLELSRWNLTELHPSECASLTASEVLEAATRRRS